MTVVQGLLTKECLVFQGQVCVPKDQRARALALPKSGETQIEQRDPKLSRTVGLGGPGGQAWKLVRVRVRTEERERAERRPPPTQVEY